MRGWRPWTVQPPPGTPIDWDNALTADLRFVYLPGAPYDLVGHRPIYTVGTNYGLTADNIGISTAWGGAGSAYVLRDPQLEPPYVTMAMYVARNGTLGSYARAFGKTYNNGGSTPYLSWDVEWNPGGAGQDEVAGNVTLGTSLYPGSATAIPAGPVLIASSYDGSYERLYANGSEIASSGEVGTLGYDTSATGNLIISGASSAAVVSPWIGAIYCAWVWGHALQQSQLEEHYRNPWQIFHRRRRAYSIPTSSGAAGTAAITEGSDTTSATGNIAIPGTASITEASDTVAATGALAIAGTAAITEGSDTVTATGVGGEVGTAAITESDDTVSAAGALSVTGSATITEGADTVAATGSAGTGATAAITEQPDATAATGGITLSGAASIFEGGDIVVASGALALPGTASITEASDSVAGTGSVPTQVTQGSPQWTISRSFTRSFTVRRSVPRSFTLSRSYTRNFTVTPMAVRFPIKGTSEKVPLTFDFTQDLPSGVTLTGTPVLGVSVSNGTDSNPTGILNGAAGFNSGSTQVIQPVQGGVNGVDYAVTCTCPTTQSNLTLSLVGLLSVRRDLN